jgi:predicted metal-dependent hydrolase
MAIKSLFTHPVYGKIAITRNPRARRIILRARPDAIYITLPTAATAQDLERALAQCGSKLLSTQKSLQKPQLAVGWSTEAPLFGFKILEHTGNKFHLKQEGRECTLFCPLGTLFDDDTKREWAQKVIVNAMRRRAKEVLPARLERLSKQHGLHYTAVNLRNSHTRWGSCNTRTHHINFSLMLASRSDEELDYVILHELVHTIIPNHGPDFYAVMDRFMPGWKDIRRKMNR